jgi:hypothetical protein
MGPSGSASLGHFTETRHAHFIIYGLVNLSNPDMHDILQEQCTEKGGSSISNLNLTTTHTFVDGLISSITFGIYNPVTVIVEGDVVK